MDKTAKEIAEATRDLFKQKPEAWTTGTMAKKKHSLKNWDGEVADTWFRAEVQDPEAERFCLVGGMMRIAGLDNGHQQELPLELLEAVASCVDPTWTVRVLEDDEIDDKAEAHLDTIVDWNDGGAAESAENVVAKLSCAVEKL